MYRELDVKTRASCGDPLTESSKGEASFFLRCHDGLLQPEKCSWEGGNGPRRNQPRVGDGVSVSWNDTRERAGMEAEKVLLPDRFDGSVDG